MAVAIHSPQEVPGMNMASRRLPLADVPNAVNSPMRTNTLGSGKRKAGELRDTVYGQPPLKKQILDASAHHLENVDPITRPGVPARGRDRLDEPFAKRTTAAPPTAFERRLVSSRDKKPIAQTKPKQAVEKTQGNGIESVRQWQRHYRKQFPQFVFYFDGVPEDARFKAMRQILSLGAREDQFFSKAVTHVVTTRPIPPENSSAAIDDNLKNVNTALKSAQPASLANDPRRGANLFDVHLHRRSQAISASNQLGLESRRSSTQTADILTRARGLGIKIWALEKLQRVLSTILETDTGDGVAVDHRVQVHNIRHSVKPAQTADLEQLLRNEKVNGPADRDMTVVTQDMVTLRGCFIYIHDMDEKTKPTMAREYTKPTNREEGKWPQFRLTPIGRCPFIEDPAYKKRMENREQEAQVKPEAFHKQNDGRAYRLAAPQAPGERELNLRRSPRKLSQSSKNDAFNGLDAISTKRNSSIDNMPPMFGSTQANMRGLPRLVAGEPVASGVQQSNITSAIRSQVISSAAISSTAPGINRRVGDTKEVSILKRKVLERGSSSYMHDVRAAINEEPGPPPRAAKRKAQETLGVLHEDNDDHENRVETLPKKKKVIDREPKAGYCENCRDKFDDFDKVSCILNESIPRT
jgi:regulatory subunit for Cdc7p protein kinase